MKPNKELEKAFERKKDFSELMYIFLGEVAFFTILATAIFF